MMEWRYRSKRAGKATVPLEVGGGKAGTHTDWKLRSDIPFFDEVKALVRIEAGLILILENKRFVLAKTNREPVVATIHVCSRFLLH